MFDCIIAGSGPAGFSASYNLIKKGLKVLVIEKERHPRVKPCAGGLPYHINNFIDFNFDEVVRTRAVGTVFSYKFKDKVKAEDKQGVKMVMRDEFDRFLIQKAVQKGVKLKEEEKVISIDEKPDYVAVKTPKGIYKGAYFIDAAGAYSNLTKLNIKKIFYVSIDAEVNVPLKDIKKQGDNASMDIGFIKKGYAWIFPKKTHLSCGMGSSLNKYKNAKKTMLEFLKKYPTTKNFSGVKIHGFVIPVLKSYDSLNSKRTFVCGDAAGLIDPLSGEGIYFAMLSGEKAAKAVFNGLKNKQAETNYTKEIEEEIITDFKYAEWFAQKLFAFPWISYKMGVKNPKVVNLFADMLKGKKKYKDVYGEVKEKYTSSALKLLKKGKIWK